jgi:hypothetical protein
VRLYKKYFYNSSLILLQIVKLLISPHKKPKKMKKWPNYSPFEIRARQIDGCEPDNR